MSDTKPPVPELRARQTVDAEWNPVNPVPIDGVVVQDVKNVIYGRGVLSELFRQEWLEGDFQVRHVTLVGLLPGDPTQWHCHHEQRDIVFPVQGYMKIGLYDGRADSPTRGASSGIAFHRSRPR
jgi:dTDP-4-dehydrorhamnose 3,5-epimerase